MNIILKGFIGTVVALVTAALGALGAGLVAASDDGGINGLQAAGMMAGVELIILSLVGGIIILSLIVDAD